MKKIVLTGGGTAGHVIPNIALLPELKNNNYEINYIGSYNGIEKKLIEESNILYKGIATGKLRRYFDFNNFIDFFNVIKGFVEAKKILKKMRPDIVFSKGGYVSVPVVFAADSLKIPVVIHESDITLGLANKISSLKAIKICCNFPETKKYLPIGKSIVSGLPIRDELRYGDINVAKSLCGFEDEKPTILIIGGSSGSLKINNIVRNILTKLLVKFNVIHICGKNNIDISYCDIRGYIQFEYVQNELKDLFKLADIVVSRAGANTIFEILSLNKPNILIPLPSKVSRGDQILNARSFEKQGFSVVVEEENLNNKKILIDAIEYVYKYKEKFIYNMKNSTKYSSIKIIINLLNTIIDK